MSEPKPQTPWPRWKIVLAYAIMSLVALTSIWSIDRHVIKVAEDQVKSPPAGR